MAYMDDYFAVECVHSASDAQQFFSFLNELIGAEIKHEKDVPPSAALVLLGLQIDLSTNDFTVTVTPDRRLKLREHLLRIQSDHDRIDSKLTGKLSFCCEALYGRSGRGPVRLLIRKAAGLPVADDLVSQAISLLVDIFASPPPCAYPLADLNTRLQPYICYADAATSTGKIAVYGPPQLGLSALYSTVPTGLHDNINILEFLALALAITTFHNKVPQQPLIVFSDSKVAELALLRGSSSSGLLCLAIHRFWLELARLPSFVFFVAHVKSECNPADALSRNNFDVIWLNDAVLLPASLPQWCSDPAFGVSGSL
ncbi:hypothetical protein FOZ60_017361 [Perkinsus olseni]|uniref:Uncharacterized protein n=1 Tax=Perkinsus olseni TaxID=32597 RepID=A0A7J6N159_PEROL|nr:hypothetical protein FOZ60_017361 [Perkinsus olseni]